MWNSISEHFPVKALLGHVIGEAARPLEGIFQPLQFNISDWREKDRKRKVSRSNLGRPICSYILL